ncbi:MAG: hypothetical protein RBT63_06385 [Bdellovibrionales bacterium]|nr:hypothetical protein [Bdellovibrionales bacterium]
MFDFELDLRKSVLRRILCNVSIAAVYGIAIIGTGLLASQALAQSQASGQTKRTTINFDDELIEGRTQKPELFVLLQNRMNNSRRLFKLRENFLPEMRRTSEEMGRADSNVREGTPEASR